MRRMEKALCKVGLFPIDKAKIKTAHQHCAKASTVLYSFIKILITVFDVVSHSVIIAESMGVTNNFGKNGK